VPPPTRVRLPITRARKPSLVPNGDFANNVAGRACASHDITQKDKHNEKAELIGAQYVSVHRGTGVAGTLPFPAKVEIERSSRMIENHLTTTSQD